MTAVRREGRIVDAMSFPDGKCRGSATGHCRTSPTTSRGTRGQSSGHHSLTHSRGPTWFAAVSPEVQRPHLHRTKLTLGARCVHRRAQRKKKSQGQGQQNRSSASDSVTSNPPADAGGWRFAERGLIVPAATTKIGFP